MSRLISVIVPVYKVEEYLDRCIESIVNQTYKNIDIILVDDGSPDRCPEMCDEWAKKDSRITVIHKKNGGLSDARNYGIKQAKGEYYLLVDSDDYIVPDAIERFESYTNDEDIIVGNFTTIIDDKIEHEYRIGLKENHIYTGAEFAIDAIYNNVWYAGSCHNMYRTEYVRKNNLYFAVGILHEDVEYLPRVFLYAKKVKYMNYEFYHYILRKNSITTTRTEKHINDSMYIYSEWKKLNDAISDVNTKRAYDGALCKYYISTCRKYKYCPKIHPEGITNTFLLRNFLNIKEFIKIIAFVVARKIYVNL